MKKHNFLSVLALGCSLAALLLALMCLSAVPEDQGHLIDDLYAENHRLQQRVETLEAQLDTLKTAANLRSWSLDVAPWPDSTGADVTLTAVPSGYRAGVSAALLVTLEGKTVASEPCLWDGSAFTATVRLDAADGYSYFCLISAAGDSQQLPLTGPSAPDAGIPVYLQSSLSAYCNLVVSDWLENPGTSLTLTDAYAQAQVPLVSAAGPVEIATAEIVLRLNGGESARVPVSLTPSEVAGSFDLTITDLQIPMPELTQSDRMELSLEIVLSDGRHLQAVGITWTMDGGKLTSAVG